MPRGAEARRDVASAAALALVAGAYLWASREYPLDSLAAPGPGVFPLAAGLFALVLAGVQAASAALGREARTLAETPPGRHPLAMVALLVAYPIAIDFAGFLPASFIVALVANRLLGASGWLRPIVLAGGITVAAYVIFVVWLAVPLPAGLLR